MGYKPNDQLSVSMILLDEKDFIVVTWQCSPIGAREIKIHPMGHLRLCRARNPCLRSCNYKKLPEQERRAWLARQVRVHHLAGKTTVLRSPQILNLYRWPLT